MRRLAFLWCTLPILFIAGGACAATVLVEAESFENSGGWVVDQQMMDIMGSPYMLAHGLGQPVEDATTQVEFPAAGTYRVFVRTRDWVAPWNAAGQPGRFQVLVNGRPLDATFGTEGAKWHWQDGGTVRIDGTRAGVALRDLTGFDGRCDAIVFTSDAGFTPPNEDPAMSVFRRRQLQLGEPIEEGEFDLVVVGGGMAGTCTAISAARLGLKVALIQDRPVLGGNNSSEVRVHLNGGINLPPYPALGDLVAELDTGLRGNAQPAHHYDDDLKLRVARAEPNLSLFLNMHAFKVEVDHYEFAVPNVRIMAVVAKHIRNNTDHRFTAPLFADCTGDGTIGYLAGADWRMGREGKQETQEALAPAEPDKMTMGASVQWYAVEKDEPVPFPECPWALQFNDETCHPKVHGDWDWETGMNKDQIWDFEQIRDYGIRVAVGNWAYLKNGYKFKEDYANYELAWMAYVAGKRESRRLLGDVVLQQQDIQSYREFPDAFVTTTWTIDLHYPHPENSKHFPGREFRSIARHERIKPYPIPYRCLYSRNIQNLFMAGRNISVTHVALGTIRVMRTGGMMGELVGMAASLCDKYDTTPRGVYKDHLEELKSLARRGVGRKRPARTQMDPPAWLDSAGKNIALEAKISTSGSYDEDKYPAVNINDGEIDLNDNNLRWLSESESPSWVEFAWDTPQSVSALRLLSGYNGQGSVPADAVTAFKLQYREGSQWRDVPGSEVRGNASPDAGTTFPMIRTDRLRLVVTDTPLKIARIWEVQLYHPNRAGRRTNDARPAGEGLQIDADYPGGNIIVDSMEGERVRLRPDLRDTEGWWFYWNFRVRGAAGRTVRFEFAQPNPVANRGPAVSTDGGRTWRWTSDETVNDSDFQYTFAPDADEVYFCLSIPYLESNLREWLDRYVDSPALQVLPLSLTQKGRVNQRLHAGRLDGNARHKVLLTARHHACEMLSNYMMEGFLDEVLSDSETGRWYQKNVEVMAVPFVDKDGVEEGDQGKNRRPHDHNRDYQGQSLYPTVAAIRRLVPAWSRGDLRVTLDLHCLWIRGENNECIYIVGSADERVWAQQQRFGAILEAVNQGPLPYYADDNLPFGKAWNVGANYSEYTSCARWAGELPGVRMAGTLEMPYANAYDVTVTPENTRAFGRTLAEAVREYFVSEQSLPQG